MIRVPGRRKICTVALVTRGICNLEVVVDVAGLALCRPVDSRQRKLRCGMVERRRLPRNGCMTHRAVLRKPSRLVIGIRGGHKIRLMARCTSRRKSRVLVVRMAVLARHRAMSPRQREFRVRVCKRRRAPDGRGMARPAIR